MKSGNDSPDWNNLTGVFFFELEDTSNRETLDKLKKIAKRSKVKPRTDPGKREKN